MTVFHCLAFIDKVAEMYFDSEMCDSPESSYIKSELKNAARRIVMKLPDKYKDVVILRVYAELGFAEIAKILGINEGSAKVIYFRAKKMLMEVLKDELEM